MSAHDGYYAWRALDQSVRKELNSPKIERDCLDLASEALAALADAGVSVHGVRVELHVLMDGCGLVIVSPGVS